MGAKYRDAQILPGPLDYYADRIRNIYAAGLQYGVTGEQPVRNGVAFTMTHGMTYKSWGENIRVSLTAQGNGTAAEVYSECAMPTQIFDMGKNKENVATIMGYLMSGAPQQQGYAQQPQHPQQQPRQPQQQAAGGAFCPECGKAVQSGSVFCSGCGTKLR